jgi:hypothetical protein
MSTRNPVPWIVATLPLMFLAGLFIHLIQAITHFGRIPRYLVDSYPLYPDWDFVLPNLIGGSYLFFPLFLIFWAICLCLPRIRYKGQHYIFYYLLVLGVTALCWLFLWYDITGFVTWYVD